MDQYSRAKANHTCWLEGRRDGPSPRRRGLGLETRLAEQHRHAARLWRTEALGQEVLHPGDARPPKQRLLLELSQDQYKRHVEQTVCHLKRAAHHLLQRTRSLRRGPRRPSQGGLLGGHVLLPCSASAFRTSLTDAMHKINEDIDALGKLAQPTARTGPFQPQDVILLPLLWFDSLPRHPPAFGGFHRRNVLALLQQWRRALFLLLLFLRLVSPSSAVRGPSSSPWLGAAQENRRALAHSSSPS